MQGYRMTMEDAHDVKINEHENLAVFGILMVMVVKIVPNI